MKKLSIAGALLLSAGLAHAQNPPSNPSPRDPGQQPPSTGSGSASTDRRDRDTDPGRGTQSDRQGKTHKMTAEIVSTDATAKTITVKNLAMSRSESGSGGSSSGSSASGGSELGEVTLRLDTKVSDRVNSLKAGDKVTLTCKTDTMGSNPPSSTTPPSGSNPPSSGSNPGNNPPATGSVPPSSTSPSDTGGMSGSSGMSSHCQTVTEVKKSS